MNTPYPDPQPNRLKRWTVIFTGARMSETVQAYSIEYTRNHVVFKTWQGITYAAFHSDIVSEIGLVS